MKIVPKLISKNTKTLDYFVLRQKNIEKSNRLSAVKTKRNSAPKFTKKYFKKNKKKTCFFGRVVIY